MKIEEMKEELEMVVMAVKNMIPQGYHKMPGGKVMKNSEMKHEKSEGKKERMKEYGTTKGKPKTKMEKIMHEYKMGELNIGKSKKMVKSRKQAIAIGLSEMNKTKKGK